MIDQYEELDDIPDEIKHSISGRLQLTFWVLIVSVISVFVYILFSPFFWVKHSTRIMSPKPFPLRRFCFSMGAKHAFASDQLSDLPSCLSDIWHKRF